MHLNFPYSHFFVLPHVDLTTHGGFNFPCSKFTLDDDEMNDDAYWTYLDHQLEEDSHMFIKEVMEIDLSEDPTTPNMVQFGKK